MPDVKDKAGVRNPWILGPKRDLLFFILTPAAIFPLAFLLKDKVAIESLAIYVLGFGGFGHHLPGFIRAYSDRELFRRFRLRFTLIPAFLLVTAMIFSFYNLNALVFATVCWGVWHGAMQVNGFIRIYDSKARSFAPVTARLDGLMCLSWFGLAILNSPEKQISLIVPYYAAGGALLPAIAMAWLRQAWIFGTVLITLFFLANAWRQTRAGTPPSRVKLLSMAVALAFWWYCVVQAPSLLFGLLIWEIFHDVQYNVLVWMFQRQRVDGNMGAGAAERFLFAPGPARALIYASLILAYGGIGVLSSFGDINMPDKMLQSQAALPWILRVTIVSALLHFYYDGFIWRMRESSTRRGLKLEGAPGTAQTAEARKPQGVPAWKHGWRWAFFILPIAGLGWSQYRGGSPDFGAQVLNLSETVPGSWLAHFLAGTYYKGRGQTDLAEEHYRETVRYRPAFAEGRMFLADMLYKKGDRSGALEQYRAAVALDSAEPLTRLNLGFLYLQENQPGAALEQFRAGLALDPADADLAFGMGSALMQSGRAPEAEAYLRTTLRLSPSHSQALNYLGLLRDSEGRTPEAIEFYRESLAADSGNAEAGRNLAAALAKAPRPAPR